MLHSDQKGKKPGCKYFNYEHMDVGLPVYRQHLTHPVIWAERGKPVKFPLGGRIAVRQLQYFAGMRGWKKRMPSCNELDSGSKFASGENCADFHLVLFCKKSIVRLFNQESKCNP